MKNLFYKKGHKISCICCNADIELIWNSNKLELGGWNNGIIDRIAAPYGSDYDGSMFIIGICDKCVTEKNDKLVYVGDYMSLDYDPNYDKIPEPYKNEILNNKEKREKDGMMWKNMFENKK